MSLLVAKGISKCFRGASGPVHAVRKCSFALPKKGLVAIKGKSGSGKSTLLNLLAGIERPSSGQILFHGEPLSKRRHPLLGYDAAFVFQHYNLIEGENVLFNVTLPLSIRGKKTAEARKLLARFGLERLAKKDVRLLSGGEKQRVAIARCLAADPAVIFADEPTGALDEGNGKLVMDALKAISSKRLIVLVSHDQSLIDAYADHVIEIHDGTVEVPEVLSHGKRLPPSNRTYRNGRGYVSRFLGRNVKKNLLKDSMCLLAGSIGFLATLLSFGFFVGNAPALEREQARSLTYLSASICKREEVEIPGSSLTLVKQTRPSKEEAMALLKGLGEMEIVDDYSYFFPSVLPFSCEGKSHESTTFVPVLDLTLSEFGSSLVKRGTLPKGEGFDECVVNEEFVARHGELLGKELQVRSRSVVTQGKTPTELFVETRLKVSAVISEFSFMNVPRVYYSYPGLVQYLEGIELGAGSVADAVNVAGGDEAIASYGSLLFLHDPTEVPKLFSLIETCGEQGFEIQSEAYSARASFLGLSEAFVQSLSLFVGITLLGLALILGMATLSSIVAGRKETAILYVLGARRREIRAIYVCESCALCLGSAAISLLFSPLAQMIANHFLRLQFDVAELISIPYQNYFGVPLFPILAVLGFALVLGLLSSLLPFAFARRVSIAGELRDE